ncbi:ISPpu9, transposase (plasmid) [Emticicia oligotrophica DSM 17448]|uniref:ISPpu9, transposase n=1 Tax=Emticicia oligotrophica (strain DSM 17448 / CIP 109782 / MTCC 6937 / GPTSA100-15) TaxID=929562 RepID=A0ABM5N7Y7_EMTOG|nr:IS110 family transposase [Emticicia oligotrophica]AFK05644.1 ISPpu9, transposase [Emticicia oligotrophica DSM 17448]
METNQSQTFVKMPVVNPNAAGIDIGSKFHVVALDGKNSEVKEFGVYTENLYEIAQYLKDNHIQTVAMEATGGYESPLVAILQAYDLKVVVTAGVNTKNFKGKKSDVQDSVRIQQLHSLGLLPSCFVPDNFSMELRSLVRLRRNLIENSSDYIRRTQKILRNANIRLDVALAHSTSQSSLRIIESIINGEMDGVKLAQLADKRCKKSKTEIAKALTGNIKATDIFQLKQCYRIYQNLLEELKLLDCEIEKLLKSEAQNNNIDLVCAKTNKRVDRNVPKYPVENYAYQIFDGINLDTIPGMGRDAILVFLSEIGNRIDSFQSAKSFSNYLRLTPNHRVTGGKIKSNHSQKNKSSMSVTLKRIALNVGKMKDNNPLTTFFNKIKSKVGTMKAITATANKMARIIWTLFKKNEEFNFSKLQQKPINKTKVLEQMKKKISNLNLEKSELSIFLQSITT